MVVVNAAPSAIPSPFVSAKSVNVTPEIGVSHKPFPVVSCNTDQVIAPSGRYIPKSTVRFVSTSASPSPVGSVPWSRVIAGEEIRVPVPLVDPWLPESSFFVLLSGSFIVPVSSLLL